VVNAKTNELENIVRINGSKYQPKVKVAGTYNITIYDIENNKQDKIENVKAKNKNEESIDIQL
jgi:hypothetical protein